MSQKNPSVVSDGYVKYEEAEVHDQLSCKISEIMKKKKNGRLKALLDFTSAKFVMGYPCARHYIMFYLHGSAILHFFGLRKYHKITKIQNGRYTAIVKLFAPKS